MAEATVLTRVKIDVNPDGITFSIEGLDSDLASLIRAANRFEVTQAEYHTFDTTNLTIQSVDAIQFIPRAPKLTTIETALGELVNISFVNKGNWKDSITHLYVNGVEVSPTNYTVLDNEISILESVFTEPGEYLIIVEAVGFTTAKITQVIVA